MLVIKTREEFLSGSVPPKENDLNGVYEKAKEVEVSREAVALAGIIVLFAVVLDKWIFQDRPKVQEPEPSPKKKPIPAKPKSKKSRGKGLKKRTMRTT